jgi:hypothetical protein
LYQVAASLFPKKERMILWWQLVNKKQAKYGLSILTIMKLNKISQTTSKSKGKKDKEKQKENRTM